MRAEQVQRNVGEQMVAMGLPGDLAPAVLQAVNQAGYALSTRQGGEPVACHGSVSVRRRRLAGTPGFVLEADLGYGVLTWCEFQRPDRSIERTQPVVVTYDQVEVVPHKS